MADSAKAITDKGTASSEWAYTDLQNRKQISEIYSKINVFAQNNNSRVFSFTSCRAKEGVTTVMANLVHHLQRLGSEKKILTIDANLQSPALHGMLGLKNEAGLADIVRGSVDPSDAVIKTHFKNIDMISSGKQHLQQSGNTTYNVFSRIVSQLKDQYDFFLIDSPPVLTSPDYLPSAEISDIVFLVIQSLKVQREAALKAITLLSDNECTIGGVIFNRVQQVIPEWLYRVI